MQRSMFRLEKNNGHVHFDEKEELKDGTRKRNNLKMIDHFTCTSYLRLGVTRWPRIKGRTATMMIVGEQYRGNG